MVDENEVDWKAAYEKVRGRIDELETTVKGLSHTRDQLQQQLNMALLKLNSITLILR